LEKNSPIWSSLPFRFRKEENIRDYFSYTSGISELLSSGISSRSVIGGVISYRQDGTFYRFKGSQGNTTCTHIFHVMQNTESAGHLVVNAVDRKLIGYSSGIYDNDGNQIGIIAVMADGSEILDDSGNMQSVRGAYNALTGTVDFVVTHFSHYAVGYNKVSFEDVSAEAWYADAVTFIAARGITSGTTATTFSPNAAVTRGQFIVFLMRAYGIEPDETSADNFSDAGSTYYTSYLAAAKSLGITNGVGDNLFKPEAEISRQDMFAMLYRALSVIGALPETDNDAALSNFSDSAAISDYAKTAVEAFVSSGIVSGSNGKLNPSDSSTRAQMAQIIFNLLSK
jgi:hypothetical protein